MASDPLSVKGIILESREYKEKDRIVTILTRNHGILDFVAKGTAKPGSKMSAVSLPYLLCDFVLTDSHGFYYLKEVSIIASNAGIMNSLEAMAVGAHCASCLKSSVLQSDNAANAYELSVYTFYALSEMPSKAAFIYAAFNWRLVSDLGLGASYRSCNGCGVDVTGSNGVYLSYNDNQCYCSNCGEKYCGSRRADFKLVSSSTVQLLDKIIDSEYSKIYMFTPGEASLEELREFTTEYLRRQFEMDITDPIKRLDIGLNRL
ncbi:MAG: DNA repair protein RecO [Saccharofermentans sp.]|nr:DNA repair protein RecO [Saccharofermentans sp.]